jgi:hypothetical protein
VRDGVHRTGVLDDGVLRTAGDRQNLLRRCGLHHDRLHVDRLLRLLCLLLRLRRLASERVGRRRGLLVGGLDRLSILRRYNVEALLAAARAAGGLLANDVLHGCRLGDVVGPLLLLLLLRLLLLLLLLWWRFVMQNVLRLLFRGCADANNLLLRNGSVGRSDLHQHDFFHVVSWRGLLLLLELLLLDVLRRGLVVGDVLGLRCAVGVGGGRRPRELLLLLLLLLLHDTHRARALGRRGGVHDLRRLFVGIGTLDTALVVSLDELHVSGSRAGAAHRHAAFRGVLHNVNRVLLLLLLQLRRRLLHAIRGAPGGRGHHLLLRGGGVVDVLVLGLHRMKEVFTNSCRKGANLSVEMCPSGDGVYALATAERG